VALLDRGVQNARTLNADPAVQAGAVSNAREHVSEAGQVRSGRSAAASSLDRRKSIAGPDSQDVADSLVALGLLRLDQGQFGEAERLVREGLAIDRRRLPPQDPCRCESRVCPGTRARRARQLRRGCQDYSMRQCGSNRPRMKSRRTFRKARASWLPRNNTSVTSLSRIRSTGEGSRWIDSFTAPFIRASRMISTTWVLVQHDLGNNRQAEQDYRQALANQSNPGMARSIPTRR
jgi:hypothetical protein